MGARTCCPPESVLAAGRSRPGGARRALLSFEWAQQVRQVAGAATPTLNGHENPALARRVWSSSETGQQQKRGQLSCRRGQLSLAETGKEIRTTKQTKLQPPTSVRRSIEKAFFLSSWLAFRAKISSANSGRAAAAARLTIDYILAVCQCRDVRWRSADIAHLRPAAQWTAAAKPSFASSHSSSSS